MIAKIHELNLADVKEVAGGITAPMTSSTLYVRPALTTSTSIRYPVPTSSTSLSSPTRLL